MRVTPSASNEDGVWRIRMNVSVQDGALLERTVSDIPIITSNRIDTQAVVNDGESLLLAGYTLEKEETQTTGVPGLSSLPGVGRLFRYDKKSNQNVVRLFLVSPHILP
jgi:type III secretion protein C